MYEKLRTKYDWFGNNNYFYNNSFEGICGPNYFIYKITITPQHLEWIISNNYSISWQICECEQFAKENNIQQSFLLF